MTIRIVTDSTCDLPTEIIQQYGIRVVPLHIHAGKEQFLDGIDITREEFYRRLPDFETHPTTAVPSPNKFRALFDLLAEQGATQVLSIHVSETLSAIVNVARTAASETTSTLVHVLDSRQLSLGTGFLVETAAKMAAAGSSLQDILASLDAQVKRTHVFALLDTLEYLRRSGRMSRFMAGFGGVLQIKPILTMYDGQPGAEKVRTHSRAMRRLMEMLEAIGPIERLALVHTHAHQAVAELRKFAADKIPAAGLWSEDITPVIGIHIGPGAVGFAAVGAQE